MAGQADDGPALAERLPLYVVVEKILEPGEPLPNDWAVHGTVGYEFARRHDRSLRRSGAPACLRRALHAASPVRAGGDPSPRSAYEAKGLMLRTALASETNVLARALNRISEQNRRTRDFTLSALRHALREVIAGFPVYRTYITCEALTPQPCSRRDGRGATDHRASSVSDRDRRAIERAVALAKRRNPASDPSVFDFLADVLLLRDDGDRPERAGARRSAAGSS